MTIRRKGDKSETEAINRHSQGNNNLIPKNLITSGRKLLQVGFTNPTAKLNRNGLSALVT